MFFLLKIVAISRDKRQQLSILDLRNRVQEYLDGDVRIESALITSQIEQGNQLLFDRHVADAQEPLIERRLEELRRYLDDAVDTPREVLSKFPIHRYDQNLRSLQRNLLSQELNKQVKQEFLDTQFKWALPMVYGWASTSSASWDMLLAQFIFKEYEITLFENGLFSFLSSYQEAKEGRGLAAIPRIAFDKNNNGVETSVQGFFEALNQRVSGRDDADAMAIKERLSSLQENMPDPRKFRSKHLQKLNQILDTYTAPLVGSTIHHHDKTILKFSQPIMVLSDVLKAIPSRFIEAELHLEASVVLYLDCDLENERFHGKNISIVTPSIRIPEHVPRVEIDVSGKSNPTIPQGFDKADTGKDGEDGAHGLPGESGGNVYIKAGEIIGKKKLCIVSNGGDGSKGGNGGDGGDGKNGADGKDGDPQSPVGVAYAVVDFGKPGEPGGKGGKGGGIGRGGQAGFEGLVHIDLMDDAAQIGIVTEAGKTGEDGDAVGKGGAGGKPGKDGIDVLKCKKSLFHSEYSEKAKYHRSCSIQSSGNGVIAGAIVGSCFGLIGGLVGGLGALALEHVDPPDHIQTEEEFNAEQNRIQEEEKAKNVGENGTISSKRQEQAVRKSAIDRQHVDQDFVQSFQGLRSQKKIFATSKMTAFYAHLTQTGCEADDGPDDTFIARLKTLKKQANEIQQKIQQQIQKEQAKEAELQHQRIIDAEVSGEANKEAGVSSLEPAPTESVSFHLLRTSLILKLSSLPEEDMPTTLIETIVAAFNKKAKYDNDNVVPKTYRDLDTVIYDETLWIDAFCTGVERLIRKNKTEGLDHFSIIEQIVKDNDISTWVSDVSYYYNNDIPKWFSGDNLDAIYVTKDVLQREGFSAREAEDVIERLREKTILSRDNQFDRGRWTLYCNPAPVIQKIASEGQFSKEQFLAELAVEIQKKTETTEDFEQPVESPDDIFNKLIKEGSIQGIPDQENLYQFVVPEISPCDTKSLLDAIDSTGRFFEWSKTAMTVLEAIQGIQKDSAKCLLVRALDLYREKNQKYQLEPKAHFREILKQLALVKDIGPMVTTLLQIPVAKWVLVLETHRLREELTKKFELEDEYDITRLIMYLDKIEAQFGVVFRKKLERQILEQSRRDPDRDIDDVITFLMRVVEEKVTVTKTVLEGLETTPFSDWPTIENTEEAYRPTDTPRSLETLKQLIQENPKNDGITEQELGYLVNDIGQIREVYTREFSTKTADEIRDLYQAERAEISACLKCDYAQMRESPDFFRAMGLVVAAIQLRFGYIPRDTQLIAVLWGLQAKGGSLLEVKTGEGKTATVIMTAMLKAMTGQTVDIVTSSPVLAKRDAEECGHVAEIFGFTTGHNCDESSELRQESYTKTIVYGDEGAFERDILMDQFYCKAIRGNRPLDVVVIDEVDSMLLDKSDHMLYLSQAIPGIENLEGLYVNIWLAVQGADMATGSEDDIKKVKQFIQEREGYGDIRYPKYLKPFVAQRLETWIKSAFIARGALGKNDAYRVGTGGKNIVTMDKNTGVQLKDSHLSEGIHQFLQLKHLQKFKPETLKSIFISNTSYFKKYKTISGLTGTLGSEAERHLLSEVYGVSIGYIPTFKPRRYTQEAAICAQTQDAQFKAIARSIKEKQALGRPVLIINDNIAMAEALHAYLTQHQIKSTLNTLDEDEIEHKMGAGEVVVSTNLSGRGTDIEISEKVSDDGGLHVIMTSCSSNIRTEKQGFGRSARSGQQGSGQFIVCDSGKRDEEAIDYLIFERNQNEKMRLAELKAYRLKQTELEEKLLETFKKEVLDKISHESHDDAFIKEKRIESALEQFSFWLDEQRNDIKEVKEFREEKQLEEDKKDSEKHPLEEKLISELEDKVKNGDIPNTVHHLLIGKNHMKHKRFDEAIKSFTHVIEKEPEFSELAEYYLAAALINKNPDNYKEAIKHMKRAKHKLNQRISTLSNYPHVLQQVKEMQMKTGEGTHSDLYAKQVSDRLEVYQAVLQSIRSACGESEFDVAAITSTRLKDEQKEKIQKKLEENPLLFTPMGLIEELKFEQGSLEEKLRIPDYSSQLKTEIIQKVLENQSELTETVFEGMLGNVDDLFERLKRAGVIEGDPSATPKLLIDLFKQKLKGYTLQVGDKLVVEGKCFEVTSVTDTECTISRPKRGVVQGTVKEGLIYRGKGVFKSFKGTEVQLDVNTVMVFPATVDMESVQDGVYEFDYKGRHVEATFESLEHEGARYTLKLKDRATGDEYTIEIELNFLNNTCKKMLINKEEFRMPLPIICKPIAYYRVSAFSEETITQCFNNPEFLKLYHDIESVKTFLKDEITKKDGEKRLFQKSDIQMLKSDAVVKKLLATLGAQGVVHPPYLKKVDDTNLESIVKEAISGIIDDGEVENDIRKLLSDAIKGIIGDIETKYPEQASEGPLQASLKDLNEALQDHFTFSLGEEIEAFKAIGLDSVIKIENKPHWWGPLVVFLLGVVQIVAGAVCMALGAPNVGMALIAEGVGDIMFAVEAQISGNFSWKAYAQNKLISVLTSILTCGVSAALCKGVQVASAGAKTILKKVGKKVLEGLAFGLSSVAIDAALNGIFDEIINDTQSHSNREIGTAMGKIKRKLEALYKKTGDKAAVKAFMEKLQREYLNANEVMAQVSQYFHQILGVIAGGMAQAVKIKQSHGAKFAALAESVKILESLIKKIKYVENIGKALTEMNRFVAMAEQKIDFELQQAAQNNRVIDENDSFIDAQIKEWQKTVTTQIVSYIKDGILKPEIKGQVNRFLKQAGRQVKSDVFKGMNFEDKKYINALKQAREKNLTRLASKESVFSDTSKSPATLLAKNPTLKPVDPDEKRRCGNTDGHTVEDIKRMIPEAMFFENDGKLLFLPPKTFSGAMNDAAVTKFYQGTKYELTKDNSRTTTPNDSKNLGHRVPVVDGKEINIPSMGKDKNYCDDQTRLFNDKLTRVKIKYPLESPEQHIERAKAYAQKEHKVVKLRAIALSRISEQVRNNETLRRYVMSCPFDVGVKKNRELTQSKVKEKLIQKLKENFDNDKAKESNKNKEKQKIAAICMGDDDREKQKQIDLFSDKSKSDEWVRKNVRNGGQHEQVITSKVGELVLKDLKEKPQEMCALDLLRETLVPTQKVTFSATTLDKNGKHFQNVHTTSKEHRYVDVDGEKSGKYGHTSPLYHLGEDNSLKAVIDKSLQSNDPYRYRHLNKDLFEINEKYLATRGDILRVRCDSRAKEVRITSSGKELDLQNTKDLHFFARHVEVHRRKIATQFLKVEEFFAEKTKIPVHPIFEKAKRYRVDMSADTDAEAGHLSATDSEFA